MMIDINNFIEGHAPSQGYELEPHLVPGPVFDPVSEALFEKLGAFDLGPLPEDDLDSPFALEADPEPYLPASRH